MKFAKRLLVIAGAVALAGLLAALLAPKMAHALVSTLVTVVNTPTVNVATIPPVNVTNQLTALSQPVPLIVTGDSNNFLTLLSTDGIASQQVGTDGNPTSFALQPGQRLVITDINWTTLCLAAA